MFKSLRDRVRDYKLISGTDHGGHGWDFPNGIREMDLMMVERTTLSAAEHSKRVEVIFAYSNAFERENPDVDLTDITPKMRAMAMFMLLHGVMRENGGFGDASAIALVYGRNHHQSFADIEWCSDWALRQISA